MKICFLAGANSIHSYKWIKYFADRGHEIHWISFNPYTQSRIENISFYYLEGNLLKKYLAVKKVIEEIKPDVLHAHYAGVNGFFGALTNFHPFILTAWGSDVLFAGKSIFKSPFVKYDLRSADLITCDAAHIKEAIIRLKINYSKINIIYFGVDTEKFKPGIKNDDLKEELQLEDSLAVISLRNLEPVYDVITFIRAIPIVLKEFSNIKFIIVGKGSEEKKIREAARQLEVTDKIRFLGWVSYDRLPDYLRLADIYISTSLSDAGIAASTAEAMACGLPVIITNTGENEKWVKDKESGYLVGIKDYNMLAEKIIDLIRDKEKRIMFGERSRIITQKKNNYYKEMEKMEKIYEKIAKEN